MEQVGDDVLINLAFNMSEHYVRDLATCESMSDLLGLVPDLKTDDLSVVFDRLVSKSSTVCQKVSDCDQTEKSHVDEVESLAAHSEEIKSSISYWDIPSGPCKHRRYCSECWMCNPCKICPSMPWNDLLRPRPRTKKHLASSGHIKSLRARCREDKDLIGDSDYEPEIKVIAPKYRRKTDVWCSHNKLKWRCGRCNPCRMCVNSAIGYFPADTASHQESYTHRFNVAQRMGRFQW